VITTTPPYHIINHRLQTSDGQTRQRWQYGTVMPNDWVANAHITERYSIVFSYHHHLWLSVNHQAQLSY